MTRFSKPARSGAPPFPLCQHLQEMRYTDSRRRGPPAYAYTRNNPLSYVDPDGQDWETAWKDVKTFAKSIYAKATIGVGVEAKVRRGTNEVKIGVSFKGSVETSQDAALTISKSVELGAAVGPTNGPKIGENVSISQTLLTVQNDGRVTGSEQPKPEITDSIGGNTTVNPSDDRVGVGAELGEIAVGGD